MPVEFKIANHTCNVIKRHIKAAFPEFDLIFIIYGENQKKKAFQKEINKIQEHPTGAYIANYIRETPHILQQQRSSFAGFSKIQTPGFLGFFRSTHTAALIFINHDRFNDEETLKNHALHLIWHAFILMRDTSDETLSKLKQYGFVEPDINMETQRHTNLTADIFSACFQKLQGKNDSFESLLKSRMLTTLSPEKGFIAENFPFPMCLETLEIVLENQFETQNKKSRHVSESVKIADEIGHTYRDTSIRQWENFARPAQEMAWCGFDKETILGCAIFTSEDTYIRSIADMVAERLNIKPSIISGSNDYNPFTEPEANERLHNKKIQEQFRNLLQKIQTPLDYHIFLKEAKNQNQKLLTGNPIGWCAHALMTAAHSIKTASPEEHIDIIKKNTTQIFDLMYKNQTFETLHNFSQIIFKDRRDGTLISEEYITEHLSSPEFSEIVTTIQQIWNIDKHNPIEKMGTKNITNFINSNNLK